MKETKPEYDLPQYEYELGCPTVKNGVDNYGKNKE